MLYAYTCAHFARIIIPIIIRPLRRIRGAV